MTNPKWITEMEANARAASDARLVIRDQMNIDPFYFLALLKLVKEMGSALNNTMAREFITPDAAKVIDSAAENYWRGPVVQDGEKR